ncbi:hypothetical protein PVK06_043759 [Gossypium arboreum]|uniref:Uncharacterized protein n=1 Tax=Gossypium arboreum TaxID=29729 RepID=A0ABR0MPQ7_GOSAR|nr:hypothetical protein PVK06_043759 [Gossypium arboreum]
MNPSMPAKIERKRPTFTPFMPDSDDGPRGNSGEPFPFLLFFIPTFCLIDLSWECQRRGRPVIGAPSSGGAREKSWVARGLLMNVAIVVGDTGKACCHDGVERSGKSHKAYCHRIARGRWLRPTASVVGRNGYC